MITYAHKESIAQMKQECIIEAWFRELIELIPIAINVTPTVSTKEQSWNSDQGTLKGTI